MRIGWYQSQSWPRSLFGSPCDLKEWQSCLELKGACLSLMQWSKRVTILVLVFSFHGSYLFYCVIIHFVLMACLLGSAFLCVLLVVFHSLAELLYLGVFFEATFFSESVISWIICIIYFWVVSSVSIMRLCLFRSNVRFSTRLWNFKLVGGYVFPCLPSGVTTWNRRRLVKVWELDCGNYSDKIVLFWHNLTSCGFFLLALWCTHTSLIIWLL